MLKEVRFQNSLKFNKDYILYLTMIMVFVMMTLLVGCGDRNEYRVINISEISGNVSVVKDNKELAAYKGMRVQEGQTIVTSGNSYTRMVLDDDKYIKLEEGSRAVVNTLANGRTEIILERGSITNEIVKPLYEGQSYIIHTPNATLAVRGTFFRVELSSAENGDLRTEVVTYGGSVVSQCKLPSGEMIEESVVIDAGYKATINMDNKDTTYFEEVVDERLDYLVPINLQNIPEEDLVDIYFAAQNGHEMFASTETLRTTIEDRNINIDEYVSAYQQAENLGLVGNATAPDDSIALAEIMETSEGKAEHHAPYDGAMDAKKNPLKEVLEEIASIFVPQEEEEEQETGDREVIYNEVASNTDNYETERVTETEMVLGNEQEVDKEETNIIEPEKPDENVGSGSDFGTPGNNEGGLSSGNTGGSGSNTPHACNHSVITERTEPTCTQDGEEVERCSICNEVLGITVLTATGHTEETETTLEATCTDVGKKTIKCTVCGEVIRIEEIPKLGHNMVEKETIPATCQSGSKIVKECSRCQEEETTTRADKAQHTASVGESAKTTCSYCGSTMIQYTNLTYFDEGVKNFLAESYDTQLPTGYLMDNTENEELNALTSLYIDSRQDMVSLKGIEYLTTVEEINLSACTSLNNISLNGGLPNLKKVLLSGNALTTLDVSGSSNLTELTISNEQALVEVNISNCTSLKTVNVSSGTYNFWGDFNTAGCSGLEITYSNSLNRDFDLTSMANKDTIKSITLENASNLADVYVSGLTGLESLIATTGCYVLENIDVSECTGLKTLSIMEYSNLKTLNVSNTALTAVENLSTLQSLTELNVSGCKSLTELDVSECRSLQKITITDSNLTEDNITKPNGANIQIISN